MTSWVFVSARSDGQGFVDNATYFADIEGQLNAATTESASRADEVRDTYTASNLWIRVITNTASVTSTLTTRKNLAAGSQTLSITSDATGTFEDTTNTDSLVSGDTIGTSLAVPSEAGTNTLTATIVSVVLAHSGTIAPIILGSSGTVTITADTFLTLGGSLSASAESTTESNVYRTFRQATTLRNLWVRISANTSTAATIRSRVNTANGNQSLSVTSGSTGEFEDASNSDSVVAGDEVCTLVDITSGSSLGIAPGVIYESSNGTLCVARAAAGASFTTLAYMVLAGVLSTTSATESNTQLKARVTTSFKNLYVNVSANLAVATCTVGLRQNGSTAISVSIPTVTTGIFEETSTTVTPATTDTLNYIIDASSAVSALTLTQISIEQLGNQNLTRDISSSIGHTTTIARTYGAVRDISSSINHTTAIARVYGAQRALSSSIAHTLALASALVLARTLSSSIPNTLTLARALTQTREISSSIQNSLTLARLYGALRDLDSTIPHTVGFTTQTGFLREISSSIENSAEFSRQLVVTRDINSSIAHATALARQLVLARALSSSIPNSLLLARVGGHPRSIDSSIAMTVALERLAVNVREIASSIDHAVTVEQQRGLPRALASSIPHTTDLQRALVLARSIDSTIEHTADIAGQNIIIRAIDSTVAHTFTLERALALSRAVASSIPHTVDVQRALVLERGIDSTIAHVATIEGSKVVLRGIAATIPHTASIERQQALVRALATSIAHTAQVSRQTAATRGLASAIAHSVIFTFHVEGELLVRGISSSIPHTVAMSYFIFRPIVEPDTGRVLWKMIGPFDWPASAFVPEIIPEPDPSGFIPDPDRPSGVTLADMI